MCASRVRGACLTGLLIGLLQVAQAGHYVLDHYVSPDGKVYITGANDCNRTVFYSPSGNNFGGSGLTGDCNGGGGATGLGSVTCSGSIKPHFKWIKDNPGNPNDPADVTPSTFVYSETCTASWDGDQGNCDNGLGSDYTLNEQYRQSRSGSKTYYKQFPGDEFDGEACNPSSSTAMVQGKPVWRTKRLCRSYFLGDAPGKCADEPDRHHC